MPRRSSNRDRLNRMRDEADARLAEEGKKTTAGSGAQRVVWVVCDIGGKPVAHFPYPQKEQAEAEARGLTAKTGQTHFVKRDKVPL